MYQAKTFLRTIQPLARCGSQNIAKKSVESSCHLSKSWLNIQFVKNYATVAAAESFLSGTSSVYIEQMYNSWLENPSSVHKVC